MPMSLAADLRKAIAQDYPELLKIADTEASILPEPQGGWSQKEELGHLIDSATNNHVRFVRASVESPFSGPSYDQNHWVRLHAYNALPWASLVDFWQRYNLLLAHLIEQIPGERLNTACTIGGGPPVTLGFVIDDYILHMRHHLDHILRRAVVTRYPRA